MNKTLKIEIKHWKWIIVGFLVLLVIISGIVGNSILNKNEEPIRKKKHELVYVMDIETNKQIFILNDKRTGTGFNNVEYTKIYCNGQTEIKGTLIHCSGEWVIKIKENN